MKRKLSDVNIQLRLMDLGLIQDNGEPVLYSTFKNRATIIRAQKPQGVKKVVFIGLPEENLFGFYGGNLNDPDTQIMKNAYVSFKKLAKGNMAEYKADLIKWSKDGIPALKEL